MERVAGDGSGDVWCVQSILHIAPGCGMWELCAWESLGGIPIPSLLPCTGSLLPRLLYPGPAKPRYIFFFRGKICVVLAQISVSAGVCRQDPRCFC